MYWWDWNRSVSRYESLETNWRFGIQNLKVSCMVDEDGVLYWLGHATGTELLTYGRVFCVLKYTASSSGIVRSARNFIC